MHQKLTSRRSFYALAILFILLQSCDRLTDATQQTAGGYGTISVEMNDTLYELTNVGAGENLGFFCGGYLLGKQLSLSLGSNPKAGDTLHVGSFLGGTISPIYVRYQNQDALTDSGFIIITARAGQSISGYFRCNVLISSDTLKFRNGQFDCYFAPSD